MTTNGSPKSHSYALCVARIMMGLILVIHGYFMAKAGLSDARAGLAMHGFPDSEAVTVIVIISSFIVGLGLIFGLFTRLAALLMAAFFAVIALLAIFGYGWYGAILYVPRVGGFLSTSLLEYFLALVAIDLCLIVGGASAFSVDAVFRKDKCRRDRRHAWAITAVRVGVGSIFLFHGWQKLTGYGLPSVAEEFAKLHFPAPWVSGLIVTLVELLGGALLLVGLFTRFAAAALAAEMLTAVILVHLRHGFLLGFFWPGGYEYALTLLIVSSSLVIGGAGTLAVDGAYRRNGAADAIAAPPAG
jgi:putative oxidoreductase